MRLKAWSNSVRRQRPREDYSRYKARVTGEETSDRIGREIKQLEEKFNKQLAELRQSKNPVNYATETGQKSVEPSQPERQKGTWPKRKEANANFVCWSCGETSHIRRNCDKSPREGRRAKVIKRPDQGEVHLKMELAGKSYPCLLDTGSSANLVPRDIAAHVPDLHNRPT